MTLRDPLWVRSICGVAIAVGLASGLLAAAETAPTKPPERRGKPVAPRRTFAIKGIRVTLDEMKRLDAILGPSKPPFRPKHETLKPVDITELLDHPPVPQGGPSVGPSGFEAVPISPAPAAVPLMRSFKALDDDDTFFPPDTQGAVGPIHFVEITNRGFALYNKITGGLVAGPISLQAFWAPLGTAVGQPAYNPFDPRLLFDQYSGRFVVISVSGMNDTPSGSWILVAISNSSDPTTGWTLYAIDVRANAPGEWADNPRLGLDAISLYVASNQYTVSPSSTFAGVNYWVIDKGSLLTGGPLTVSQFVNTLPGGSWQPMHAFGSTSVNYLISSGWTSGIAKYLRVRRISYAAGSPVLTDLGFIRVADYGLDALEDAPQATCGQDIDVGDSRLNDAVFRNGRIWTAHHVDDPIDDGVGRAEVAWYEIDPALADFSGSQLPVQQGRVSDPATWYYYPSIAVNDAGCVALGFSGSGPGSYPGAYYTVRKPFEPPGTMEAVALLKAGEDFYYQTGGSGKNRWGDYSATMMDPFTPSTFYTVQEYAETTIPSCLDVDSGIWGTWVGVFACGGCTSDASCDDGLFCNGVETCDEVTGVCSPGAPPTCFDGLSCTLDTCDSVANACVFPRVQTLLGADDHSGNLFRVDPLTGNTSILAAFPHNFRPIGLATDPTDGKVYALSEGPAAVDIVNPNTGAVTPVGQFGIQGQPEDMDFLMDGRLFAGLGLVGSNSTGGDTLAAVNKSTGAATLIGSFGGGIGTGGGLGGINALAASPSGVLFGASDETGRASRLYAINTNTGVATLVGAIVDQFGSDPLSGVVSLAFDRGGALYGGGGAPGGDFFRIDPATAIFTLIASGMFDRVEAMTSLPCGCFGDSWCDDGSLCSGWESCDPGTGACLPGSGDNCDDLNPCTVDSCDNGTVTCVHVGTLPPGQVGDTVQTTISAGLATWSWAGIAGAANYNTYRGTIPASLMASRDTAAYDHACFESADAAGDGATQSSDAAAPPTGSGYYYLINGENSCSEGPLGTGQGGVPRPNPSPCPTPP